MGVNSKTAAGDSNTHGGSDVNNPTESYLLPHYNTANQNKSRRENMKMIIAKRDYSDLAAELDGLSSLLSIIAQGFLENEVTASNGTIGAALFACEQYADRISTNLQQLADQEYMKGATA